MKKTSLSGIGISVGITVRDDKGIVDTIGSILHQLRLPDEMVVVDAFSTDGTKEAIEETISYYDYLKIPFIFIQKDGNIAVGRNEIIDRSSCEYVAMTDSDCIIDYKWLYELEQSVMQDRTIDVVGGSAGVFGDSVISDIKEHNPAFVDVNGVKIDYAHQTRNVLLKKDTIKKVGGFNPDYVLFEDMDIMYRIAKSGGNIVYNPKARIYHKNSANIERYMVKTLNNAIWSAKFAMDHPDTFGGESTVGKMVGKALVEGLTGVMMVIAGTLIDKSDISNPVERLFHGLTGIIEGVIDELTFPIDQKSRLMQMLKSLIDR
ncbi:MAG TPA: glycosyltransferase [Halobacteria archaeon]|jgi:glycosyltransferase involved in cell wall biosynthesis|nr:glycosyltransferase [Halobacteria archaeon]